MSWSSRRIPGPVLQLLPSRCFGMQPGSLASHEGGGIMRRTSMDSIVSPASADLQMPSLMDWDQEITLYGSVNVSLRESQHYCFALLLFLAKFRYCIHMSLPGFFWCCGLGEEDIQLLMLGFAEVLTLNKSPPSTIRAGVQGSHWHVRAPPVLCMKRTYCFPVLSPFHRGYHRGSYLTGSRLT